MAIEHTDSLEDPQEEQEMESAQEGVWWQPAGPSTRGATVSMSFRRELHSYLDDDEKDSELLFVCKARMVSAHTQ